MGAPPLVVDRSKALLETGTLESGSQGLPKLGTKNLNNKIELWNLLFNPQKGK
jgi:hypothetical protein